MLGEEDVHLQELLFKGWGRAAFPQSVSPSSSQQQPASEAEKGGACRGQPLGAPLPCFRGQGYRGHGSSLRSPGCQWG